MKKLLLMAATVGIAASSNAQTRLSLYEEFSGENCGPCAIANPGLWTLLSANKSKVLLIKYQSPIPSAGPIYLAYTTVTNNRLTYYSVPFAPYGRLNGTGLGTGTVYPTSPGHVSNLLQADIDAAYAVSSPFDITTTAVYNTTGDSVTTTVEVKCVAAYAPSGASLKLRVGMIEHLVYATPPGTNGEKEFHNVVREMYPDADGTTIPNAWTVGMTQTYVLKGKVRSFVSKPNKPSMVAWIQNDNDKSIPQASQSAELPGTFATNINASAISTPNSIFCAGSSVTSGTVTLKNNGTSTTITSATIWYRVGTGAWSSTPWTGSLAPGASTTVTLGPITMPAASGVYTLQDSVTLSSAVDNDVLDNVASTTITVISTAPTPLPFSTDFEVSPTVGGFPNGYYPYDIENSGRIWLNGDGGASSTYCHSGRFMPWFRLSAFPTGSTSLLIIPTPAISGNVAIDFWEAYAQTTSGSSDKLEVVYSKDCGQTWTTVWSATGSAHATTSPTSTYWLPDRTVASTWAKRSVSLTGLPSGSIFAFRATDGGGNNLFIDDVTVRSGLSVENDVKVINAISLSPNPARDFTMINFHLNQSSKVDVQVIDALGRVVLDQPQGNLTTGSQQIRINTAELAGGLYMVKVSTENSSLVERFTVVK